MRRTHALYETVSGSPVGFPIFASSSDWRLSVEQPGTGTFEVPIPTVTRFTPTQWRENTRHWWHTIVEFHDGVPMYAGMIRDKMWDVDRHVLTLDTVTFDTLWQDRFTFGVTGYPGDVWEISAKSYRAAIAQTIQRGTSLGTTWPLPLDFQTPLNEAGTFSKEFRPEDWATVEQIINDLKLRGGGLDVVSRPKVVGNALRFDVLVGNPVPGPTIEVPASVRKSRVGRLQFAEYGRDMLSGLFGKGEGAGDIRPVGQAGFLDGPPMPVRDAAIDLPADDSDIQGATEAALPSRRTAIDARKFTIRRGDEHPFPLSDLTLGGRLTLLYSGDTYWPRETRTGYVVGLSYSSSSPDEYSPEVVAL